MNINPESKIEHLNVFMFKSTLEQTNSFTGILAKAASRRHTQARNLSTMVESPLCDISTINRPTPKVITRIT